VYVSAYDHDLIAYEVYVGLARHGSGGEGKWYRPYRSSYAPKSVAITTDKQSSGVKQVDCQCYRNGRGRGQ